jgi:hypothetical protein
VTGVQKREEDRLSHEQTSSHGIASGNFEILIIFSNKIIMSIALLLELAPDRLVDYIVDIAGPAEQPTILDKVHFVRK